MGKADEFTTPGSTFRSACAVETQEDATALLKRYAHWLTKNSYRDLPLKEAARVARGNINYLLRGNNTPSRITKLWERVEANHIVFGAPSD
jgi:hypothetical protein